MRFEPIAIVGRGTVLPGGLSPEALWNSVYDKRDLTQNAPSGRWRLSDENALCSPENVLSEYSWSKRGGYVQGFSSIFTPDEDSATLDPLFHWVLHCAQSALQDVQTYQKERTGLIMGNLSFPSSSMSHYAETVWFPQLRPEKIDPRNRFMSGFPILWAASKLGLNGPSFALDAACASALYAIKLACDRLHRREADVMLAGAVNRADDLFLHVGFCSLKALSPTGQSRPFHADADGLLPAEGAG
ncbi:MAG: polyketide synthase, partial [Myxococcota bacterium]|nr:polyketide synthase [Myxococcota bacterium]